MIPLFYCKFTAHNISLFCNRFRIYLVILFAKPIMNLNTVTFTNKLTSQKLSKTRTMFHCNKHVFEAYNTDIGNQGNPTNFCSL